MVPVHVTEAGLVPRMKLMKLATRLTPTLFVFLIGCGNESEAASGGPGSGSTDTGGVSAHSSTTDACIPGEESCECNAGECLAGLVCASQVCVILPQTSTTADVDGPADSDGPGDSGGGADSGGRADSDSSSEAGAPACIANTDCAPDDVCFADGVCDHAYGGVYEVRVLSFSGCPDDGVGGPEVYYEAREASDVVHTSAISGCPPVWPNEAFELGGLELTGFVDPFVIHFLEEDVGVPDYYIAALCWSGPFGCVPVPPWLLHDGGWAGLIGDNDEYAVEVQIDLIGRQ